MLVERPTFPTSGFAHGQGAELLELADPIEQDDASSPTDEPAARLERAVGAIAELARDLRQAKELRQLLVGRKLRASSSGSRRRR
jgi:hypothetical protein